MLLISVEQSPITVSTENGTEVAKGFRSWKQCNKTHVSQQNSMTSTFLINNPLQHFSPFVLPLTLWSATEHWWQLLCKVVWLPNQQEVLISFADLHNILQVPWQFYKCCLKWVVSLKFKLFLYTLCSLCIDRRWP